MSHAPVRSMLQGILPAFALCLLGACMSSSQWRPLEKPWTPELVRSQRRLVVTLADGEVHEIGRPVLVQSSTGERLAWKDYGPDERYPDRSIALDQVERLDAVVSAPTTLSSGRVFQAILIAGGLLLWASILLF